MSKIQSILKKLALFLISVFFVTAMFASLRGMLGNPNDQNINTLAWRDNGPFELSPERGRFALLYSLVEDHSFYFSVPIARFVVPDLGYKNGHYVSLFAPGVSYIAIPGYLIGKYFNASQVGAFAVIALFALLNSYLVKKIVQQLGGNEITSVLAGLVFLFATPAFAYGVDLYQHHISTFLILLSIFTLTKWNSFWSNGLVFFLCAMSIPVDYPNLFLMLPIGIFTAFRLFNISEINGTYKISFKTLYIFSCLAVVIPLTFFLWFNKMSYGDPLQFSGTVGSARAIDANGLPTAATKVNPEDEDWYKNPDNQEKSAVNFFKSRYLLNGFYIHLFSLDRGIVTFTPIIFLGLFGVFVLYQKKNKYLAMLISIFGINLLLYSMWGDPWGGWAFGSRYMIPSYAILSILLGIALTKFGKKWWFIIPFWILLIYSIGVNTLGALTTNTNPPRVETLALEKVSGKQERYMYDRNWEYLKKDGSKSFVFQTWGSEYLTAVEYYYLISGSIATLATILTIALCLSHDREILTK